MTRTSKTKTVINALRVVKGVLNNRLIRNQPMKIKSIKKRCERCEEIFEIPLLKKCPARETLLRYYPCPKCGYFRYSGIKDLSKTGRCKSCYIPFGIVDHHAKGLCSRCIMRYYRSNDPDKNKKYKIQ